MAAIAESPAVGTTHGGPYGGRIVLSLTLRGVLVAVYGGVLLAGAASSMLAVFGRQTVAIPLLTLLFLLFGPGAAVGWLLPGFDPAVRLLTGLFAGAVLDCVVAESMLALRMWSVRGGIAMVLLSTAALLTAGAVARVRGGAIRAGG
jgi:hypothetical protein